MTARTDKDEAPRLTKWDWERAVLASDLRPIVRQLLLTLGVYMDGAGANCYPSADALAAGMGVQRGTVFDLLKEATKAGWLERASKGGRGAPGLGGTGKTNLYLPRRPDHATVGAHPTVAEAVEVPPPGATVSGHGDQPSVATRRNQTKDQTKDKTPGYFDEDPLTVEEQMIEDARIVAVRSACELGCTPERWWNSSRRHRDELVLRLAERLRAGEAPLALLDGLVAKKPPRDGVDHWPKFLLGRLGTLQPVPIERRASA